MNFEVVQIESMSDFMTHPLAKDAIERGKSISYESIPDMPGWFYLWMNDE